MPYRIPKNRNTVKTIKLNNGVLTFEVDENTGKGYWFRNGKYLTPHQLKSYKYYDSAIKGYRTLDEKAQANFGSMGDEVSYIARTPVYTPNMDRLRKEQQKHAELGYNDVVQSIPVRDQEMLTLRTKGRMNLADVPYNMLDSIAVNAGRSGTDFWTDAALIGKESTFGGRSAILHHPFSPTDKLSPHWLTNNHAYFNNAADDYSAALHKKYDLSDDYQEARAEDNVRYAYEHGQIIDKTPHYSNYVLADAFKRYQVAPTKYNTGQKNYVPMLNGIKAELQGEKQLQNYWNTRGKQEYARGQKEGMAEGGFLQPQDAWGNLSMKEKAAMMEVAVKNGITNLREIRQKYNEFAEGGNLYDGESEPTQKITTGGAGYIPNNYGWGLVNLLKKVGLMSESVEEKKQWEAQETARELSRKTRSIPATYIGGTPNEAREEYWRQEPVMQHAVDSIAGEYNISPDLLKYRLNHEGFVDKQINNRNLDIQQGREPVRGYRLLNFPTYKTNPQAGFAQFGLDDVKTYIDNGKVSLINEKWHEGTAVNEKGRPVNFVTGVQLKDNLGITAAVMKYFKEKVKKDFPNLSDSELDRYANAYYNRGIKGGRKWAKNGAKGYKIK